MNMKKILLISNIIVFAFVFVGCENVSPEPLPDSTNSEDPAQAITEQPTPLTETYLNGYVSVFLPVQDSGKPIYSHQIDFTYDAENIPVDGDYTLIRPVIHLYISHEKDGGDEVFDFSPPIEITILFDGKELAQLQEGASAVESFAIAIYDKNQDLWIPQETDIVDKGDGTGYGVVMISSWTSGAAWICKRGACRD